MADENNKPTNDQDVAPVIADPFAATDALQPSDPLKGMDSDAGDPLASPTTADAPKGGANAQKGKADDEQQGNKDSGASASPRQAISDGIVKLKGEAGDRARTFADQGKAKATGALDQIVAMLNDAAGQVDEKLGEQYGQYARNAAEQVQGFSSSLNDRSVEDLLDDARDLVRKSPTAALGIAAAIGFAAARLVSAGLDNRDEA
ncbi:hypothetical protein [Sphingomonas mucosissima]|uniref:DUF883 domain-containing protein n=1 Tax=Sphingomonas mucosissima TaxID=370959 RepID=A0A245ZQX6_9SPHN|nr:hypothetical protein [Sphingomonas mucosissima]OWK32121.1 hypothetical protein SPMU_04420 [Sphingomonas mucosissima]